LAIYDNADPMNLLWESGSVPNTGANAEVVVPILAGTPAQLRLVPGTYWLAWQTDSPASIGSYTPGEYGEGFNFIMPYGPCPAQLAQGDVEPTSELWTQYLTFPPPPSVEGWAAW
ncbi:hypothetical protein HZA57_06130, partial [Candidatus Poribacteria bacterium]|nr:hypothetical protein [Candidatus Poribacteria bacterium]